MKIIYSKDYLRKSSIPNYPFTGYYYRFGSEEIVLNKEYKKKDLMEIYRGHHSDPYPCNTMIRKFNGDLRCKVSIKITDEKEINNEWRVIYIIAIDNTIYKNRKELDDKVTLLARDYEHDKAEDSYFEQVAAIMIFEKESDMDKYAINIYDMQYVPKCSFSIVSYGLNGIVEDTDSRINNGQVLHYQSEKYDKINFYDNKEMNLVESNSGNRRLRDLMAEQNPFYLDGHMTIDCSGLIKL